MVFCAANYVQAAHGEVPKRNNRTSLPDTEIQVQVAGVVFLSVHL